MVCYEHYIFKKDSEKERGLWKRDFLLSLNFSLHMVYFTLDFDL